MIKFQFFLVNEVPLRSERANMPFSLSKSYQRKNCCFKVLGRRLLIKKQIRRIPFFCVIRILTDSDAGFDTEISSFSCRPCLLKAFHGRKNKKNSRRPKTKKQKPRNNPLRERLQEIFSANLWFFGFLSGFSMFLRD